MHIDNVHRSAQQSTTDESNEQHNDASTRKRQCCDDKENVLPIANSKNTLFKFTSPVQSSQSLEASRVDVKYIEALAPIMTIVTTYNPILSQNLLEELRNEKIAHATLSTLKRFTTAHSLLLGAVDQSLERLPSWLWTYPISDTTPALEMKLIQAIRFTLTDFVNICTNSQTAPFCEVNERTFLINHVVPIFKSLGNQSNMLCFNWCETQLKQQTQQARVMMNIGQLDEMTLRFVGGLGFDRNSNERKILISPQIYAVSPPPSRGRGKPLLC